MTKLVEFTLWHNKQTLLVNPAFVATVRGDLGHQQPPAIEITMGNGAVHIVRATIVQFNERVDYAKDAD